MPKFTSKIFLALIWMVAISSVRAGSLGDTPTSFFTNLAEHLLESQLNLSLTRIQVWPTNQYSPAVHRLLQVAANIYDSTTNHFDSTGQIDLPSVFRPQFSQDATGVFISGYTNDNDTEATKSWCADRPEGIPLVIGVKKGVPNFNEFSFQTFFQITRKLEVGRAYTNSPPNQTNQIMLVSISNLFGVEIWNSYSQPFSNNFQVYVSNMFGGILSNAADGFTLPVSLPAVNVSTVMAATNGDWHFNPRFPSSYGQKAGFMAPLYTNLIILTNSRYSGGTFDTANDSFLPRTGGLPSADWRLVLTNRLTYILYTLPAGAPAQVLDVVCLSYQTNLNLTELLVGQNKSFIEPPAIASLWDTNRIANPATLSTPTRGILEQLAISLGNPNLAASDWKAYNAESNDKTRSIASFQAFIRSSSSTNLFQQAPFSATRRFVHSVTWQANDPLVHFLAEDLAGVTNQLRFFKPNDLFTNDLNLGRLNQRYRPWLGNPTGDASDSQNPDDAYVGIRDPGVFNSDDWNFPTNLWSHPELLGRVHRGTTWQTIYLKAEVASPTQWLGQSPDSRTHPTNDWKIASVFFSIWNTNVPKDLFSINQTSAAAWASILGGMSVLSNTVPTFARMAPINFDYLVIDPNSAQAQGMAAGIIHTRLASHPQYFRQIGDILATPELTTQSPFLNRKDDPTSGYTAQDFQQFGFTDEAYEKIPEQLLPLVRADPILFFETMGGQLQARATAFAGYWYALESSRDLQNWTTFSAQFADSDTFSFPNLLSANLGQRFYRVRLWP